MKVSNSLVGFQEKMNTFYILFLFVTILIIWSLN